jgi:LuxR family transcriptional regulator, maltose regulon positive regulatory protein
MTMTRRPLGGALHGAKLRGATQTPREPLAKICRPTVRGVLARPRLFRRLDAARTHAVIWVSGPPGSGKTTLVAHYVADRKVPCLWYRVDEGDVDLATFFYYMPPVGQPASGYVCPC